jgi:hypothetical protein
LRSIFVNIVRKIDTNWQPIYENFDHNQRVEVNSKIYSGSRDSSVNIGTDSELDSQGTKCS